MIYGRTVRVTLIVGFLLSTSLAPSASDKTRANVEQLPKLLTVREQQAVRERWLKKRLDTMLLPMMRQQKIDMWIISTEEFHLEPVVQHIAPPLPYVGRREFLIFADRGGDKLDRIALVRYGEEHLKLFFEVLQPPGREIAATLRRLVEERRPKAIGRS